VSSPTDTKPVDTKRIAGRRKLHFANLDQVLADVEQLAAGPYTQLGNWSLAVMCDHLAKVLRSTTEDRQYQPPWIVRPLGRLFKRYVISRTLPSGFRMPRAMAVLLAPEEDAQLAESLENFRAAVARFKTVELPECSPFLGKLTRDQWEQFHCRHAELHLSFLVPQDSGDPSST
jgi:hypothetical protein